jgi:Na+/H+ antiporter NhaB
VAAKAAVVGAFVDGLRLIDVVVAVAVGDVVAQNHWAAHVSSPVKAAGPRRSHELDQ